MRGLQAFEDSVRSYPTPTLPVQSVNVFRFTTWITRLALKKAFGLVGGHAPSGSP